MRLFFKNTAIHPMNCNNLISNAARFFQLAVILAGIILLQACTTDSVNDGLRPSTGVGSQNTQAQTPPQQDSSTTIALAPIDAPQNAPLAQNTTPSPGVVFLPVLGPPQSAVSQLSTAVRKSANSNAITIIPSGQAGATYQIKGYFSALDDGSGTRFIFIWDVLDRSGKNIHRISGEERTTSRKADPWSAIDSNMINNVVERTMQNLRGWMDTRA